MGRRPCCSKEGLTRGAWTSFEDQILTSYINSHGEGNWRNLPLRAGLKRCGKSCRLRWLNYLRPDIKRGNISRDEEDLITRLHKLLGNRWSLIAGRLPGRTDNEIKNYWNTTLGKKTKIKTRTKPPSSPNNLTSARDKPATRTKTTHTNHEQEGFEKLNSDMGFLGFDDVVRGNNDLCSSADAREQVLFADEPFGEDWDANNCIDLESVAFLLNAGEWP